MEISMSDEDEGFTEGLRVFADCADRGGGGGGDCYARADTGETGCEGGAEHADAEAGGVAGGFGDCGGCDVSVGCGNLNCADREAYYTDEEYGGDVDGEGCLFAFDGLDFAESGESERNEGC